jgi:hypothetical protein
MYETIRGPSKNGEFHRHQLSFGAVAVPSGEGKILKIEVTKEGFKKIEQVYPDWQRAQAKTVEALGESTYEMIIASGNTHLLGGMAR